MNSEGWESEAQDPGLLEVNGDREWQERKLASHEDWEDALAEMGRESDCGYHGNINATKERVLSSAKWQSSDMMGNKSHY